MGNVPLYQFILLAIVALAIVIAISNFFERSPRRRRQHPLAQVLFFPVFILSVTAIISEIAGWALMVWRAVGFVQQGAWEALNTETVLGWVDFYPTEIAFDWSWSGQLAAHVANMDATIFLTVVLPFALLAVMVSFVVACGLALGLMDRQPALPARAMVPVRARRPLYRIER